MDGKFLFDGSQPEDLNIKFKGSYALLKYIIKKYQNELPYAGSIIEFGRQTLYSKDISYSWEHYGVQPRAWNGLNKDLIIYRLIGKITDNLSLEDLKKEFQEKESIASNL